MSAFISYSIVIGTLVLILVLALGITWLFIKTLDFIEDRHPTWVGEGLRNRLFAFLSSLWRHFRRIINAR